MDRWKDQKVSNQLEMFEKLFELHFDLFGLIEKGLALNINNVKEYNYESQLTKETRKIN